MRAEAAAIATLAGPVGWTLLHSFWQACLVWLILRFGVVRIPRPDVRVHLAFLGLAAFVVMQVATLDLCLRGIAAPMPAALATTARGTFVPTAAPAEGWFGDAVRYVDPWMPLVVVGWTLYAVYRLLACARGVRRTQRLLEQADPLPEPLLGRLQRLAARVGVRAGSVRFVAATLAVGPGTIGWLRPFIFVPPALLLTMPPAQIEAIVAHELAHVLRRDYLLAAIQFAIEGVYACNPFVRRIVARLNDDVELACDRVALRHVDDPAEYARALRAVAAEVVAAERLVMPATGGSLVTRVRWILRPPSSRERAAPAWTRLGLAGAGAAVLLAISTSALATASSIRSEARFLAERTLGQAVDEITGYDGDVDAVRAAAAKTLGHALPPEADRAIALLADAARATPAQFRSAYATLDELVERGGDPTAGARVERFLLHTLGADAREPLSSRLATLLYWPQTYAQLGVTDRNARRLFNAVRYENDRRSRVQDAMEEIDAVLASQACFSQVTADLATSPLATQMRCASLARGHNDVIGVARFAARLRASGDERLGPMIAEFDHPTRPPSKNTVYVLPRGTKIVNLGPEVWSKTEASLLP